MLRPLLIGTGLGLLVLVGSAAPPALANPGKAQNGVECEDPGARVPGGGQSANSPGSPFHDGTGGANYSPNSQYDVACFPGPPTR
jgi:hypothetical protein